MNQSNAVNVHAHAEKKKQRKEKALTVGWATKAQLHAVCHYDVHGWGNLSEIFLENNCGRERKDWSTWTDQQAHCIVLDAWI